MRITKSIQWLVLLNAVLAMLLGSVAMGQEPDEKKSKLPRKVIKQLDEEVIPAMQVGNDSYFLEVVTPMIERAKPDQLIAIEEHCKAKGAGSIQTRFSNLVLQQVEQGAIDVESKLPQSIALYLADEIAKQISDGLMQIRSHEVMSDPLEVADDWRVSEQVFWEVHVFKNEFLNAQRLVNFGVAVLQPHFRRVQKSQDPKAMGVFQTIEKLAQEVPATYKEMLERESEMRWVRFNESHKVLHGPGNFETLLTSAMCVELDGEKLKELFQNNRPGSFTRPALNDPNLPATVEKMIVSARQVGDDISQKAILLRSGMHYWLRGRYGQGPLANGLLKSPEAVKSQTFMEGLYMPKRRPKPISDYHGNEESSSGYDRRHYYTWAVEYRPLLERSTTSSKTRRTPTSLQARATGETFW